MAGTSGQHESATELTPAAATKPAPTSPARSDKSSDSEGKPVRDKLKETRIDAQGATDPAPGSDQHMEETSNGSANAGEQSTSGSDSDRGRLRRKRSREDFEDETGADNQSEKKQENIKGERHHTRKRSRDVKEIESGLPLKPSAATVERIEENDGDEQMISPKKDTSKSVAVKPSTDTSPKNKRTRDQVEEGAAANSEPIKDATTNGKPNLKAEDERESKRPRDKEDAQPAAKPTESTSKIPPGSGFANTSSASPFATMSPKLQASKTTDRPELLPQTSDDKFKASGFGTFSSSTASPFGGLASSAAKSPFGAATGSKLGSFAAPAGNKLSSFAGNSASSAAPASGFGGLASSNKSAFGGGTFGGGFQGFGTAKSTTSSFETPADLTIKGIASKTIAFGAPGHKSAESAEEDDENDDDAQKHTTDEERKTSQPLLSQQPHETGEEGEETLWTGRAKLYTMAGEGAAKAWKERGVGTFKFNVTIDEPKKARFVLRADGTHRLLLNAAVTKKLVFGGDEKGDKPKEGRLLFNSPNTEGELEMHLLKFRAERAVELWEEVSKMQEFEL